MRHAVLGVDMRLLGRRNACDECGSAAIGYDASHESRFCRDCGVVFDELFG